MAFLYTNALGELIKDDLGDLMSGATADDCCCDGDPFDCDCPYTSGEEVILSPSGWAQGDVAGTPSGICGTCTNCNAINSVALSVPQIDDCTWSSAKEAVGGVGCITALEFGCNSFSGGVGISGTFSMSDCDLGAGTWDVSATVIFWSDPSGAFGAQLHSVTYSKTVTGNPLLGGVVFTPGDITAQVGTQWCVADAASLSVALA